ncbi:MAG: hypothetical protein ACRC68_18220 [Clostridium sp.]
MNTDKLDIDELEYLTRYVNNHGLIKREPIKILFASNDTLEKLKLDPDLIDSDLFISSDITMLGLDKIGNKNSCKTADGLELSKDRGILLIEAKDITKALIKRLNILSKKSRDNDGLVVNGIVDKRLDEVKEKLTGSRKLFNMILNNKGKFLSEDTNVCIGLFIDYKLTDVDEFGLTGDIGLLRDEIDEYSKSKKTIIFTNRAIESMEDLIKLYR